MDLINEVINNNYYVKEFLSEDSMTHRWKATSLLSDHIVKLTFLKAKDFISENPISLPGTLRKLTQLNHPGLAKILGINEYQGHKFIISEYIKTENLFDYWKDHSSENIKDIVYIIIKISSAIEHAHKAGVTHGNINLHNIWIHEHHEQIINVKISNIGFVPLIYPANNSDAYKHSILKAQDIKNTKNPYQLDISAIGVVFYWLLVKKLPKTTKGNKSIILPSDIDSKIPHIVDTIVMQMLDTDSMTGFQKIEEYQKYLNKICSGETIEESTFKLEKPDEPDIKLIQKKKLTHKKTTKIKLEIDNEVKKPVISKLRENLQSLNDEVIESSQEQQDEVNKNTKEQQEDVKKNAKEQQDDLKKNIREKTDEVKKSTKESGNKAHKNIKKQADTENEHNKKLINKLKAKPKKQTIIFLPEVDNSSPEFIKKLFSNVFESEGYIYLIDQDTMLKYSNLIDYYYYYLKYNGGIFINIAYDYENTDQEFFVLQCILQAYKERIDQFSRLEQERIKKELYNSLSENLKRASFLLRTLFESDQNDSEAQIIMNKEFLEELTDFIVQLLTIKSPLVMLFRNIEWIDEYSNLLLSKLKERIHSQPLLIIGIYSSYGKEYEL